MMILYGKPVAEKIYSQIRREIKELKEKEIQPFLATIIVGENPVSLNFIKIKEKAACNLEIGFKIYHLSGIATEQNILELIGELNKNKLIHGIIIQLPLPKGLDTSKIIRAIAQEKDVDGLLGKYPASTAAAILEILKFYQIDYHQKKMVIVGRGRLVGGPLEKMLMAQAVEPLVCDLETKDSAVETLKADILISATGVSGLIKPAMISKKTVVIDAGTSEIRGKIAGDVDPAVYSKVAAYTPVPGGVGPVTVACLMRNLVEAAKK